MRRTLMGLAGAIGTALLQGYRRAAARRLKIQALIWYVKSVAQVRRVAIRVVAVVAALLLALAGFILIHIGLFLWLPVSLAVKGLLFAALGLIYLVVAGLLIRALFSEGAWLRCSGASDLIANVTRREPGS